MEKNILRIKECISLRQKYPELYDNLEIYLRAFPDIDDELLVDSFLGENGQLNTKRIEQLINNAKNYIEITESSEYKKRLELIKKKMENEEKTFQEKVNKLYKKEPKEKKEKAPKEKKEKAPKEKKEKVPKEKKKKEMNNN